ncbi:PREDICTED: uncharacterized protein LOC109221680 [Nicotiana attenuata]|uniref:uncharacterized protein LOC109220068 n=1 Tax=Nicotiana attenuata TaxID=49451 RepID=UPI0009051A57|nr:PREDICTED: uncharacterized protein LOC109220068 [Nicotiana attenuata]XP_019241693.1 PREDICTED: uncharacterized protein LOC109221680 [Nicotiana attenuata]
MDEDSGLWDVICEGPFVPTKNLGDPPVVIPKTRKEFNDADRKAIEKNFRAKKILSAKEIWEALQTAHEGTTQVKKSIIDMLTTEYELLKMQDNEYVQEMRTRLTSTINELHSLGETIPRNKLVRKILNVLPSSWESKVNAIIEAKDLQELTIDELVGNLKTYEMKKKKDSEIREPKKEKNLVLKTENNESSAKRNLVPNRRFNRKNAADNVVKQALAARGDSSSESGEDDEPGNSFMMVVESESTEYDSIFALMAQSDDEDDDDDDEKLMSLENVLIHAYHSLVNDRDVLTVELGEAEQSRDDLVIVAVDLRESIENLKKVRNVLKKRIKNVEQEDDLLVVVMDLKETIGKPTMKSRDESYQKGKEVARNNERKQPTTVHG